MLLCIERRKLLAGNSVFDEGIGLRWKGNKEPVLELGHSHSQNSMSEITDGRSNSVVHEIRCGVEGCGNLPVYEVILYDIYLDIGEVFFEQDITCPYLCPKHMIENEEQAHTVEGSDISASGGVRKIEELTRDTCEGPPIRRSRGFVHYPHTNKNRAQGFIIYRPIEQQKTRSAPGVM